MNPDATFRWLLIMLIFSIALLGLMDNFSVSFLGVNEFLFKYRAVILSLGTLFLISALALFAAHITNKSNENKEKSNRRVQAELQLAKFRQTWINEMRDDISELIRLSFYSTSKDEIARAYQLSMKIEMRLNTTEPQAQLVADCLLRISSLKRGSSEHTGALTSLTLNSQKYLKNEWDRLKHDLKRAQGLDKERQ